MLIRNVYLEDLKRFNEEEDIEAMWGMLDFLKTEIEKVREWSVLNVAWGKKHTK